MALIYLSYGWSATNGSMPRWMRETADALVKHTQGGYVFYDPASLFIPQLEQAGHAELPPLPNTPQVIMEMLGAPIQMYMNISDEVKSWGNFIDFKHKTWCDLFFLLRSSLVLVDLNLATRNQQSFELTLAKMRGVPVIGINDLERLEYQAAYCVDMTLPSHSPRIAQLILSMVPFKTEADNGQEKEVVRPEGATSGEGAVQGADAEKSQERP